MTFVIIIKLKEVSETSDSANELREKVLLYYTKTIPPTETAISLIKNEVRKIM